MGLRVNSTCLCWELLWLPCREDIRSYQDQSNCAVHPRYAVLCHPSHEYVYCWFTALWYRVYRALLHHERIVASSAVLYHGIFDGSTLDPLGYVLPGFYGHVLPSAVR